jgi:hypothetical protein
MPTVRGPCRCETGSGTCIGPFFEAWAAEELKREQNEVQRQRVLLAEEEPQGQPAFGGAAATVVTSDGLEELWDRGWVSWTAGRRATDQGPPASLPSAQAHFSAPSNERRKLMSSPLSSELKQKYNVSSAGSSRRRQRLALRGALLPPRPLPLAVPVCLALV